MSFEKNRRIVKVMGNRGERATVGGKTYYFKSQLELKWAQYLQFLKEHHNIIDWSYETQTFYFAGEKAAPVQYTPDFRVNEAGGDIIYQETKGWHDGQTNTKLRRMAEHYPDVRIDLVLQHIPRKGSKGAHRRAIAAKYTRRIIDASVIFKQIKGII